MVALAAWRGIVTTTTFGDSGAPMPVATTVTRISSSRRGSMTATDDSGVVAREFLDNVADLRELANGQIRPGGDVHENASGAVEIDVLKQRTANSRFRGCPSPIFAGGAARTHHGHAHLERGPYARRRSPH